MRLLHEKMNIHAACMFAGWLNHLARKSNGPLRVGAYVTKIAKGLGVFKEHLAGNRVENDIFGMQSLLAGHVIDIFKNNLTMEYDSYRYLKGDRNGPLINITGDENEEAEIEEEEEEDVHPTEVEQDRRGKRTRGSSSGFSSSTSQMDEMLAQLTAMRTENQRRHS